MKKTIATKIGAAAFSGAFAITGLSATVGMIPVLAAPDSSTNAGNNKAQKNDLAPADSDIIDNSKTGSLTIYKYDTTSAEAAGDYHRGDIKATGQKDGVVESKLKDYAIKGVEFSYLKVGEIETYSTAGATGDVVVVYEIPNALREILELSNQEQSASNPTGYYDMTKAAYGDGDADDVCQHKNVSSGVYHYTSTQINDALAAILERDDITAKNKLESYLKTYNTQITDGDDEPADNGAAAMPETDATGKTTKEGLPLGLYLIVETRVPEEVTDTVNPWFVSLPFTNTSIGEGSGSNQGNAALTEDGGGTPSGGTTNSNAGADFWLYNCYAYPKNQTGNPTIDKSVRNAYSKEVVTGGKTGQKNDTINSANKYESALKGKLEGDGDTLIATASSGKDNPIVVYNTADGKNTADTDDASYVANRGGYTKGTNTQAGNGGANYSKDFEYRDTTTASEGDILDFIVVTKLPHITSKATYLSEFTFTDRLSKGLTYNGDPRIAFYDNKNDASVNNTKAAKLIWEYDPSSGGFFTGNPDDQNKVFADGVQSVDTDGADGSRMVISLTENGLKLINNEVAANNKTARENSNTVDGNTNAGLSDYYMVLYYTATVESNDQVVLGDEGNKNDVALVWSRTNNAYYNTITDRTYAYTYEVDLTKTFSKAADNTAASFKDVEFKLYNGTDAYYVLANKDADGVYHVYGRTQSKEEATPLVPGEGGKLILRGIEADKYQLTETKTKDGYSLLRDEIVIDVKATDRDVKSSVAGTIGLDKDAAQKIIENYGSGIVNEDGQLVELEKSAGSTNQAETFSTDVEGNTTGKQEGTGISNAFQGDGQTPAGRPIGETDMFVGEIKSATATVDGKTATVQSSSIEGQNSDNARVVLNVQNNKNWLLPATGGMGTYAATIAGIVILGMGIYSINKKKENA